MNDWLKAQLRKQMLTIAVIVAVLVLWLLALPASASPLQISDVSAGDIGNTTATITWTTDEPGNSTVNYGTTIPLDNSLSNSTFVTSHSISLTDLSPGTFYYYEVASTNESGNTTVVDNNGGFYYTFNTDPYPPAITAIDAGNITDTSAIITWATDRLADSVVNYGDSEPPALVASNSTFVLNHTITLTGLTSSTPYYFYVSSTNQYGNTTIDDNGGAFYTFTTGVPPPTISGVSAGNMTDTSSTITWTTDQPASSAVNYGNSTSLGATVSEGNLSYNHVINLTGLSPNTLYYYEVSSTNADGGTTVSPGNNSYYNFTTPMHLELQGWGWGTSYGEVASATLVGYAEVVERENADQSFSVHLVGNLTLQQPSGPVEIVPVELYGSRVRSMLYLRQEVTGESSTFTGTWISGNDTQFYIMTSGLLALPNPDGQVFKTARLYFIVLRTPDVEVPAKQTGNFVDNLEVIISWSTKFVDKLIDNLVGTGAGKILGDILAKLMALIAALRGLGTPYFS